MKLLVIIGLMAAVPFWGQDTLPQQNQQGTKQALSPTSAPGDEPGQVQEHNDSGGGYVETLIETFFDELITNWVVLVIGVPTVIAAFRALKTLQEQTAATRIAADAAKKSAETCELALKLDGRADVLLENAGLVTSRPELFINAKIRSTCQVALDIKNFGRTRAQNVRCLVGLEISGTPGAKWPQGPFILGPGETQRIMTQTFQEALNEETYEKIANGEASFGFSASITYDDIFGESRALNCEGIYNLCSGSFILGKQTPTVSSLQGTSDQDTTESINGSIREAAGDKLYEILNTHG